jgi:EmrB/QacA subfamily drug resistance transporter
MRAQQPSESLAQAAVIPLSGWLSDRFGAKRIYISSLVLFTAGSAVCGLALNAQMLVTTRVLQGPRGGMRVLQGLRGGMAVLYRLTPPDRRGAIFGLFGLPVMVAPALGPLLSGYLLQYANWRLIFLINLPVGALALLIGLRVLPRRPAARAVGALDSLGILLGSLAFAAVSFGVSQSTSAGWTAPPTLGGIGLGLVALVAFVKHELQVADPILNLRVFRSRDFTLGVLTQWAAVAAMFGTFFLVPLFLQQVRGYGALETGVFTLPAAIMSAIFMQLGGRAFDRLGVRPPLLFGLTLIGASLWMMSGLSGDATGLDLLLPMALMGSGMGSMMMALNTHVLNSAPRDLVGRVTSLTNALQSVVASLAIATWATLLQTRIPVHMSAAAITTHGALTPPAVADATAFAFGDVYRAALLVIAIGWLLAWTLRRVRPAEAEIEQLRRSVVEQDFVQLEESGEIRGAVLDVGCGTGEHVLFLAQRGHTAWGVDSAPLAIEKAREKALQRGVAATFAVADAFELETVGREFDTVIDSGLMHIFTQEHRSRLAASIASVLVPGGSYLVLGYSDQDPGPGPPGFSPSDIHALFSDGWRVNFIRETRFEIHEIPAHKSRAWLASTTRLK